MYMVKTTGEVRLKHSQRAHPGFLSESYEDLRGAGQKEPKAAKGPSEAPLGIKAVTLLVAYTSCSHHL